MSLQKTQIAQSKGNYIGSDWRQGKGSVFSSYNPANREILWIGHESCEEDINECIEYAQKASKTWQLLSFEMRLNIIKKFHELLQKKADDIALIISQETGKTLWESKSEVATMTSRVDLSLDSYQKRCEIREFSVNGALCITRHKPHGVVVVMSPYNFPGHLAHGHIVPSFIAGNVVILKPSELTPLLAQEMVALWHEAGIPSGVLQLIQGGKSSGQLLTQHPGIDGVFFTGSSKTGVTLNQLFASKPEKILALEMGGNNPLIIGTTQNLEGAVYLTIQSAFMTSGQRCTCCRRLFVLKDIVKKGFLNLLKEKTQQLVVGPYWKNPEPFMGPVITFDQREKLLQDQKRYLDLGGKILLKMESLGEEGAFLTPGIMNVTQSSSIPDEESFGPFLQVYEVDSLEEAVILANQTRYGLSAGIVSDIKSEFDYYYDHARVGILNWNQPTTGASGKAPFGGVGLSGNHRPTGYYAADYCSYPIVSTQLPLCETPKKLLPGMI